MYFLYIYCTYPLLFCKMDKIKYYINAAGLSGIFSKNKISLEDLKTGKLGEQLNFICQESIEIPTKKLLTDLKLI